MYRGCLASSRSALRSSRIQDVRAPSLTTVPGHTARNTSSFVMTSPARSRRKRSSASALGASFTSCLPRQRPRRGSSW